MFFHILCALPKCHTQICIDPRKNKSKSTVPILWFKSDGTFQRLQSPSVFADVRFMIFRKNLQNVSLDPEGKINPLNVISIVKRDEQKKITNSNVKFFWSVAYYVKFNKKQTDQYPLYLHDESKSLQR